MKDKIKLDVFPESLETLVYIKNTYHPDKTITWVLNHILRNKDIESLFLNSHIEDTDEKENHL